MIPERLVATLGLAVTLLAALLFVTASPVSSQETSADRQLEVNQLDTTGSPELSAIVTAPASALGLDESTLRFTVNEEGEPVDVVVSSLGGENLEVVLLIDTSGSMNGAAMDNARTAALEFLDIMPATVPISVRGFGARAQTATEFTTDREVLRPAIAALTPSGETALYDALIATAEDFGGRAADRRVAFVVTDGGDTVSTATAEQAIEALEAQSVEVNAVSLLTSESDPLTLAAIADQRGGAVVSATDPVGLSEAYNEVAALLVNRYELTWTTPNGGPTKVEIRLLAPDGWHRFNRTVALPALPVIEPESSVSPTTPDNQVAHAPSALTSTLVPESTSARLALVGLGLLFTAMLVATATALLSPPRDRQLSQEFSHQRLPERFGPGVGFSAPMQRLIAWFDRRFQTRASGSMLSLMLDRAGVRWAAAEVAAATSAATLVIVIVGLSFGSVLAGIAFAGSLWFLVWAVLRILTNRRQGAFADQLDTTLVMLAGTLRAGYGINQALDTVATETDAPTNEEFQRALTEVRLGKSLPQGLMGIADRVESEDFLWAVQAIEINAEIGGNLAEVLENVASTIRARTTVKRKITALSAEGRISAVVLYILPFLMFGWIRLTNPNYLSEMTGSTAGFYMLALAAFLLVLGGVWLKRIVTIEY